MFRKKVKIAQLTISTPYNAKRLTNGYEWPYNVKEDNSASEFIEMIHSPRSLWSWYTKSLNCDDDSNERNPLSQSFFADLLAELDDIIQKMKMQEYDNIIKEYQNECTGYNILD